MYIKMQLVKYKFIIVIYENILLFIKYKNSNNICNIFKNILIITFIIIHSINYVLLLKI